MMMDRPDPKILQQQLTCSLVMHVCIKVKKCKKRCKKLDYEIKY